MKGELDDPNQPEYRTAIVQAKIVLLLLVVGIQLFLLTVTVDRLLAGETGEIAGLALASAISFVIGLGIWRVRA
ncbi:MAG: hypothetical protein HYX94_06440 [Chloroflexi bacterium]|nr:hypothetical protein [Chloroflexota bacterium]